MQQVIELLLDTETLFSFNQGIGSLYFNTLLFVVLLLSKGVGLGCGCAVPLA